MTKQLIHAFAELANIDSLCEELRNELVAAESALRNLGLNLWGIE